jgi:hypothetical protein
MAVVDCLSFRDNRAVLLSCRHLWRPKALIYRDAPDEQLRRACTSGDMTLVRRLLSRDDSEALMASFGASGETALMRACRAGRVDIAKLLLLKGANKRTALFREAADAHLPRYDAFTFAGLADDPASSIALCELLDASQRPPARRRGSTLAPTLAGDNGVLTIVAHAGGCDQATVARALGLLGWAFLDWQHAGFQGLSYGTNLRRIIPASTLIVLGVQFLFGSFFLGVLGLRTVNHNRDT